MSCNTPLLFQEMFCSPCNHSHAASAILQNDLRMSKEKARRKQAIIQRQEEELAAREGSLDSMRKDQATSSRQLEHLQEDNQGLKVTAAAAHHSESKVCSAMGIDTVRWYVLVKIYAM